MRSEALHRQLRKEAPLHDFDQYIRKVPFVRFVSSDRLEAQLAGTVGRGARGIGKGQTLAKVLLAWQGAWSSAEKYYARPSTKSPIGTGKPCGTEFDFLTANLKLSKRGLVQQVAGSLVGGKYNRYGTTQRIRTLKLVYGPNAADRCCGGNGARYIG